MTCPEHVLSPITSAVWHCMQSLPMTAGTCAVSSDHCVFGSAGDVKCHTDRRDSFVRPGRDFRKSLIRAPRLVFVAKPLPQGCRPPSHMAISIKPSIATRPSDAQGAATAGKVMLVQQCICSHGDRAAAEGGHVLIDR